MLHTQRAAVERVRDVRDVACREDAGHARLEVLVDEDAVVDGQPCRLGKLDPRGDADADDDQVAVDRAPVVELDALDARLAAERPQRGAGEQLDAVVAVDVGVQAADVATQNLLERDLGALDERDVASDLPRGGGHLRADPAGPDDRQAPRRPEPLPERVRVGEVTQREHALQAGAGDLHAARARAGRQQQTVIRQPLAVGERDLAGRRVDPGSRRFRFAARSRALRRSLRDARGPARAATRRADSPSRAGGARRAPRAPRPGGRCARRSPRSAGPRRPWRRRGRRRR